MFLELLKIAIFALLMVMSGFLINSVYATEISAIPERSVIGPNDWIKIALQISGYSGGEVNYKIHKPDGTSDSGMLSSLQASKKTHIISRDAMDHQFGDWTIDYSYNGVEKSTQVTVEPLIVRVATDKEIYYKGDKMILQIVTNSYQENASYGDDYVVSVLDKNNKTAVLGIDSLTISADSAVVTKTFLIDDFLNYNPPGKYSIQVMYYGLQFLSAFEVSENMDSSIYVGTDKTLYLHDDPIQVNILVQKLSSNSGQLKIYTPSGKLFTKNLTITSQLTKVSLNDIPSSESGTYTLQFQYNGVSVKRTYDIAAKTLDKPNLTGLDLNISLNKKYYQPGENIQSIIQSSKQFSQPISYWLVDPNGNVGKSYSFDGTGSNEITLQHTLDIDSSRGSWKLYVKYGLGEKYQTFLVKGEPLVSQYIPDWLRNAAKWWSEGKISDADFIQSLEFLIKNKIIIVSEIGSASEQSDIPYWIRNNAKWWSEGIISDNEFVNNISYLIKIKVIHV